MIISFSSWLPLIIKCTWIKYTYTCTISKQNNPPTVELVEVSVWWQSTPEQVFSVTLTEVRCCRNSPQPDNFTSKQLNLDVWDALTIEGKTSELSIPNSNLSSTSSSLLPLVSIFKVFRIHVIFGPQSFLTWPNANKIEMINRLNTCKLYVGTLDFFHLSFSHLRAEWSIVYLHN